MINRLQETKEAEDALTRRIIGLAMNVHRTLGPGFHESVYANALVIELQKAKIDFQRERAFPVSYDGVEVGVFYADLVIAEKLILELKAAEGLSIAHSVQLVNYLAAAKLDQGLLLNFGNKSLEFKTKTRIYRSAQEPPELQS